jgi:hypothetical protein
VKDRIFWWGASFALLPTLAGAVGVSYSGMAAINAIWHLVFHRDAPELFMALGGIAYGMAVGVLVPLFLFGTAARLICLPHQLGQRHSHSLQRRSPGGWGCSY